MDDRRTEPHENSDDTGSLNENPTRGALYDSSPRTDNVAGPPKPPPSDNHPSTTHELPNGADADREPQTETIVAQPQEPPKKATPAEKFHELTMAIQSLREDFTTAMNGVRASHALVQRIEREGQFADRALIDALARMHGLVFRYIQENFRETSKASSFAHMMLQMVEGEFQNLGVVIIRPHPGEPVDYGLMEAIGSAPCAFWQKPGSVAEVERCGFALKSDDFFRILHKAKVVVRNRGKQEEGNK